MTKLFEQISGSDEYVQEYQEASAVLARISTEFRNKTLHRNHIQSQLNDLQHQVAEIELYERQKQKILALMTERYLFAMKQKEMAATAVSQDLEAIVSRKKDTTETLKFLRDNLRSADAEKLKEESKIKEFRVKEVSMKKQVEQITPEVAALAKKKGVLEKNLKKEKAALQNYEKQRSEIKSRLEILDSNLKELVEEEKGQNSKMKENVIDPEIRLEFEKCEIRGTEKTATLKLKLHDLQGDLKQQNEFLKNKEKEIGELQNRASFLEPQIQAAQSNFNGSTENLTLLLSNYDKLLKEYDELKNWSKTSREDKAKFLREENEIKSHLRKFASISGESRREIEFRNILSDMKSNIEGIHGPVSALCSPVTQNYSVALMSSLGTYTENIVVESWQTAKRCVEYLKQRKLKPMSFISMEIVEASGSDNDLRNFISQINQKIQGEDAEVKMMLDCAVFDPKFTDIFKMILKNCLLVNSLEVGRFVFFKEAPKHHLDVRVVSVSGERILRNGNLHIDCSQVSQNRFDQREKSMYEERLEKIREELSRFPADDIDAVSDLRKIQTELQKIEAQIAVERQSIKMWESQAASRQQDLESCQASIQKLEKFIEAESTKRSKLRKEEEDLNNQIGAVEKEFFKNLSKKFSIPDIKAYIYENEAKHREAQENLAKIQKSKRQLEMEKGTLEEEIERNKDSKKLKQQIDNFAAEISQITIQQEKHVKQLKKLEEEVQEMKNFSSSCKAKFDEMERKIRQCESKISETDKTRLSLEKSENGLMTEIQKLQEEISTLLKECIIKNVEIPLAKGTMENVKELLGISRDSQSARGSQPGNFEIDFSVLPQKKKSGYSKGRDRILADELAAYDKEIADLQEDLDGRRPNMKARERFKTVREELETEENNLAELSRSRRKDEKRFREIRHKRKSKFMKCFNFVKEKVNEIYHSLTSVDFTEVENSTPYKKGDKDEGIILPYEEDMETVGGQAYLDLEEPQVEEPYNTGIVYHAMPPAKRFRDMQLLSGGEKTMAATALLFALQAYHPAPFFIVDEVDAALDPKNVASLGKYFRSVPFQILVITLKDKLFSQADLLVGVFKEIDTGSSGVLQFSLRPYKANKRTIRPSFDEEELLKPSADF
eukprot:GHVP01028920.1.p1 GENE.GHVP01028920.1~~GHVP01028920.1.p1  ORF type:complete len:1122 (+),score=296.03 GHVP01028920.1:468-3833(+)